jgi:hypothetical protein
MIFRGVMQHIICIATIIFKFSDIISSIGEKKNAHDA